MPPAFVLSQDQTLRERLTISARRPLSILTRLKHSRSASRMSKQPTGLLPAHRRHRRVNCFGSTAFGHKCRRARPPPHSRGFVHCLLVKDQLALIRARPRIVAAFAARARGLREHFPKFIQRGSSEDAHEFAQTFPAPCQSRQKTSQGSPWAARKCGIPPPDRAAGGAKILASGASYRAKNGPRRDTCGLRIKPRTPTPGR